MALAGVLLTASGCAAVVPVGEIDDGQDRTAGDGGFGPGTLLYPGAKASEQAVSPDGRLIAGVVRKQLDEDDPLLDEAVTEWERRGAHERVPLSVRVVVRGIATGDVLLDAECGGCNAVTWTADSQQVIGVVREDHPRGQRVTFTATPGVTGEWSWLRESRS